MTRKVPAAAGRKDHYEKSERTREKLLRAAETLFIERGYDGVSINDIAVEASTTKGHIYYYFENKQELFDSILEEYFTKQTEAMMKAVEAKGDLRVEIHAVVDAYLDFIDMNPGFPRLVQREVCSRTNNMSQIAAGLEPMFRWGTAVLKDLLPEDGPLSSRHFFVDVMAIALNYYTYSPLLQELWGYDPMAEQALAERRRHVHGVLDSMIGEFLEAGAGDRSV